MIDLPSTERANILLNLNRKKLWNIIMLITGHGVFKNHLFNIGLSNDKICIFYKRALETGIHLICHCVKFEYHRVLFYGRSLTLPNDIHENTFKYMVDFINASGIIRVLEEISIWKIQGSTVISSNLRASTGKLPHTLYLSI